MTFGTPSSFLPVRELDTMMLSASQALTQLTAWLAWIDRRRKQEGRCQTWIRRPKQPDIKLVEVVSKSETEEDKRQFKTIHKYRPTWIFCHFVSTSYLPIHFHEPENVLRLDDCWYQWEKWFHPWIRWSRNCLESWDPKLTPGDGRERLKKMWKVACFPQKCSAPSIHFHGTFLLLSQF